MMKLTREMFQKCSQWLRTPWRESILATDGVKHWVSVFVKRPDGSEPVSDGFDVEHYGDGWYRLSREVDSAGEGMRALGTTEGFKKAFPGVVTADVPEQLLWGVDPDGWQVEKTP